MEFPRDLTERARNLFAACDKGGGLKIALAESCTGGLVAAALTDIPGSSAYLERGFVTYSNRAKAEMLGVPRDILDNPPGAVSEQVAKAMAEGALAHSGADIALAITGIAGPGGATPSKPVGLVHMAALRRGRPILHARHVFAGNRGQVRLQAAIQGLDLLIAAI